MNMKGILKYFILPLLAVFLVGCNESENEYNADTAVSPYEPVPGRRLVSQVITTDTIDGRAYQWEYNFVYDAKNRIKQISSNFVGHKAKVFSNNTRYYECRKTSNVCYYYLGNDFRVEYWATQQFPDYPDWNSSPSAQWTGFFNSNGTLARYSLLDFAYNAMKLKSVHTDSDYYYEMKHDAKGNVIGYKLMCYKSEGSDVVQKDCSTECVYSSNKNNTNIDFSAYLGVWGFEESLPLDDVDSHTPYQLAALGMTGATSGNLPSRIVSRDSKGNAVKDENGNPVYLEIKWKFDTQESPVSFVTGACRKTRIKYVN